MSISIYLFSRIISTTTVSTLRGVLFLSWLPLPPHCFFFHPSPPSLASISLFCCAASTSPFLFLFLLLTQVLSFPTSPPSFLYDLSQFPLSSFARSLPLCYSLLPLLLDFSFFFPRSPSLFLCLFSLSSSHFSLSFFL